LLALFAVLAAVTLGGGTVVSYHVEALWFGSLGFTGSDEPHSSSVNGDAESPVWIRACCTSVVQYGTSPVATPDTDSSYGQPAPPYGCDGPGDYRANVAREGGIGEHMPNTRVDLPSVHVAGSDKHCDAHIEVGAHGFALFLAPDAENPMLDIDGTPQQLDAVVRGLQAALTSRERPHDRRRSDSRNSR
jgi:hypothetical protein